jgi:hypothetical protein
MMRRLSSSLLYAGLGICALGAVGLMGGMWVTLSPQAVRRIAMALPFTVGGALLIAGALVGRAARRSVEGQPADRETPAVGAGLAEWTTRSGEPEPMRRRSTGEPPDRAATHS